MTYSCRWVGNVKKLETQCLRLDQSHANGHKGASLRERDTPTRLPTSPCANREDTRTVWPYRVQYPGLFYLFRKFVGRFIITKLYLPFISTVLSIIATARKFLSCYFNFDPRNCFRIKTTYKMLCTSPIKAKRDGGVSPQII